MTKTEYHDISKTAFPSRHRTMQAKSILNGSSISPFIFHSKFISHKAKSFRMCEENYVRSVDAEESNSTCKETKFSFTMSTATHEV